MQFKQSKENLRFTVFLNQHKVFKRFFGAESLSSKPLLHSRYKTNTESGIVGGIRDLIAGKIGCIL